MPNEPKYPPTPSGTPWEATFEERSAPRRATLAAGRLLDLDDLEREVNEIGATTERVRWELRQYVADAEADILRIEAEIAAMSAERASG